MAKSFGEAFAKAQMAAGLTLPTHGTVFLSVSDHDKPVVAALARRFMNLGFDLVATHGTRRCPGGGRLTGCACVLGERRPTQRCGLYQG